MPERVWLMQGYTVKSRSSSESVWEGLYGNWTYNSDKRRGLLVLLLGDGSQYQLDNVPSVEAAISCARGFDLGAASGIRQPALPREGGTDA